MSADRVRVARTAPAVVGSRTLRSASLDEVLPQLIDGLLDAIDSAVIVVDPDGVVELWNDAAERLYGWSAAEAVGTSLADLIVPISQSDVGHEIAASLRNGDGWKGTFLCRRRDGSHVPVRVTDVPVPGRDGSVRAVIGISRNVTDLLDADRDGRTIAALSHACAMRS